MSLSPLSMSQTKDELRRHLSMSSETYALMAKETDQVYKWLTADKTHLKKNCKRKPPYDWSDIKEKSKDDAMVRIARGENDHTRYYWNQASPTSDCPNWIARWFLYHKFRNRDGRNRNAVSQTLDDRSSHHHHHHHHGSSPTYGQNYSHQGLTASGSYEDGPSTATCGDSHRDGNEGQQTIPLVFYDPARDEYRSA